MVFSTQGFRSISIHLIKPYSFVPGGHTSAYQRLLKIQQIQADYLDDILGQKSTPGTKEN